MDASGIAYLLQRLGSMKLKQGHRYLNGTCPLAQWRHPGGIDHNPGFGVKVNPDGTSSYKCLSASCGIHGSDLKELIWSVQVHSHQDLSELINFVQTNEKPVPPERFKSMSYERPAPVDVGGVRVTAEQARKILGVGGNIEQLTSSVEIVSPEEAEFWKGRVPPTVRQWIQEYMAKSKLTREDALFWELGVAPKVPYRSKQGKDTFIKGWRIIFPVRDCKNQVVGWSGRLIDKNCSCGRAKYEDGIYVCEECERVVDPVHQACVEHGEKPVKQICPACGRTPPPKYFHRQRFLRNLFFYGEHLRVSEAKKAILVEGFGDVMSLYRWGFRNVFGVMGSFLSDVHVEKLCQWVDEVIIVPDGDEGGRIMANHIVKMIDGRLPTTIKMPPPKVDPGELSRQDAVGLIGFDPAPLDEQTLIQ